MKRNARKKNSNFTPQIKSLRKTLNEIELGLSHPYARLSKQEMAEVVNSTCQRIFKKKGLGFEARRQLDGKNKALKMWSLWRSMKGK